MRKHTGKAGITGLLIAILVAVAVYLDINLESLGIDVGQTPMPSVTEPAKQVDWYQIYFTDPTCPPEDERSGGIDDLIVADLMTAKERVDVAAYDLDVENIVNSLIDLEGRELPVRVVTDTDNGKISAINRLRRHGISVVEDKRSTIMHNKFIVIDDRILWMGSMNLTVNGIYCNNNNFVRFESPELAANYAAEMDEMYEERIFGPTSPDNALEKTQSIYDIHVENYFAVEDEIAPVVANIVSTARDEILFMAFSFTHDDIGDAMIDRAKDGIDVRGIFETVGSDTEYSLYPKMSRRRLSNLKVQLDTNSRIMHHKVIIVDRRIVVFGSYNFTGAASDSNDENVIIIHDADFASHFVTEFERLWVEDES